jgi:four helix bundle protein
MGTVKDLIVYKKSFALAMEIYEMVKKFPKEEKYSLVDQIVRSSRSVCVCISESYRKRRYVAHFIAKITDADMENCETQTWLEFSLACKYINEQTYKDFN